ncbi:MAG: hypothetical protein ACLR23_13520 [Clostridia bacterium]
MKIVKGILLAITIVTVCFAVYAQMAVFGENLLYAPSQWGFFLARSYRWITIAAVILVILTTVLFVLGALREEAEGEGLAQREREREESGVRG